MRGRAARPSPIAVPRYNGGVSGSVWVGVAVGGALGALARYGLSLWVQARLAPGAWAAFPLGTLIINVLGSFLLAVTVTLAARGLLSAEVRLAFGTGFVGAFTTFSTFEWETLGLFSGGRAAWGALYLFGNLALGYAAVLLGRALGERLGG